MSIPYIKKISCCIGLFFLTATSHAHQQKEKTFFSLDSIQWDNELTLPPCEGMVENIGLAGVFSGISEKHLVIAGGANFPTSKPWEGGIKKWWSTLYYLSTEKKNATWTVIENALPHPLAYGVSIQLPEGILCIGGCDSNRCYADVFMIQLTNQGISISLDWPPLPVALANASGAFFDGKIYIAGGQEKSTKASATKHFFMLDSNNKHKGWQILPSWPGEPKGYAVCAATNKRIYLFSGRNYIEDKIVSVQNDGFEYDPGQNKWEQLPGNFPVMAGTSLAIENQYLILMGGVTTILPTNENHPGFSPTIRLYDVKKRIIKEEKTLSIPIPVTTVLVSNDSTLYISSGEIKPGIRSPHVLRGNIHK